MAVQQLSEDQIKRAMATHQALVGREQANQQLSSLYNKSTLTPKEMSQKVALQSVRDSYGHPTDQEMANHATVVSMDAGRKALGITGKWPTTSLPHANDGDELTSYGG